MPVCPLSLSCPTKGLAGADCAGGHSGHGAQPRGGAGGVLSLLQQWYTSSMNVVCTWLTDRMDLQLHIYQLKTLIRIVKVIGRCVFDTILLLEGVCVRAPVCVRDVLLYKLSPTNKLSLSLKFLKIKDTCVYDKYQRISRNLKHIQMQNTGMQRQQK